MRSRIVTYAHQPKRPPRKRKAAPAVPAIVKATRRAPTDTPPIADEPTTPANDDSPVEPAPPAANTAIVTAANRKRAKRQRPELPHDPEADERVKAFFVRMIRPGGALPPEKF